MRGVLIGFAVGVCVLQMQAQLLPVAAAAAILLVASCALGLSRRIMRARLRVPLHLTCGAAIGFAWATLIAQLYLQQELPLALEGRDVTVIGTIDNLPDNAEQGVRFNFAVERVLPLDGVVPTLPPKLALMWSAGFHGQPTQAVGDVQPGERWQLTVRLARPHGNANPYGFDYEAWLLEQRLRATGSVRSDDNPSRANVRLDRFVFSPGNLVEHSRAWLRARTLPRCRASAMPACWWRWWSAISAACRNLTGPSSHAPASAI
ncbi:putative membrane metal-binding protein [Actimicrobium sp. GrIS 1.19]|uniref:ComEC/Rec2 family competence protein n=1 Tax=Actimicrobium sp. GrIS 1.19 TaxID=3071708 RepID=UPI002E01A3EB|nr:putative membrane metal-binding protein [Actimicrobium sp. GrIS 1.19]